MKLKQRKKASTTELGPNCVLLLLVNDPRQWESLRTGPAARYVQIARLDKAKESWGGFARGVAFEIWCPEPVSQLAGLFKKACSERPGFVFSQLTEERMRRLLPQRLAGVIEYPVDKPPNGLPLSTEAVAWIEKNYNRQREYADQEYCRLQRECPDPVVIGQVKELCLQIDAREGWHQPEELLEAAREVLQAGPFPDDVHAIIHVLDAAKHLGFALLDEHGAENLIQQVQVEVLASAPGGNLMESQGLSLEQRVELALREIYPLWDKIPQRFRTETTERLRADLVAKGLENNAEVMEWAVKITKRLYAESISVQPIAPPPVVHVSESGSSVSLAGLDDQAAEQVRYLVALLAKQQSARAALDTVLPDLGALVTQLKELRDAGPKFGQVGQAADALISELLATVKDLLPQTPST